MKKVLAQLNRVTELFEDYFPAMLMIATSLAVFLQVILRYFFARSLIWPEEFARHGIVWFVMIGASLAVRENSHAKVDAVIRLFPPRGRKALEIFAIVASIGFTALLTMIGVEMVFRIARIGNVTPTMRIPMSIPYAGIPIGAFLMMIRYIQDLIAYLKRPADSLEGELAEKSASEPDFDALQSDEGGR